MSQKPSRPQRSEPDDRRASAPAIATPPILPCLVIVISLIIFLSAGGLDLLASWLRQPSLIFASQMTLLTVALCLTPSIAHWLTKRGRRVARIVVESFLFTIVSLSFGLWLFGTSIFGVWIAYAVVLVLLLEVGSNIV